MTPTEIKEILLWSVGINYGILVLWFGAFSAAHGPLYRLHARWFKLSIESFDAIHYAGMAIYKVGVLLLNLVPLIALSVAVK